MPKYIIRETTVVTTVSTYTVTENKTAEEVKSEIEGEFEERHGNRTMVVTAEVEVTHEN